MAWRKRGRVACTSRVARDKETGGTEKQAMKCVESVYAQDSAGTAGFCDICVQILIVSSQDHPKHNATAERSLCRWYNNSLRSSLLVPAPGVGPAQQPPSHRSLRY